MPKIQRTSKTAIITIPARLMESMKWKKGDEIAFKKIGVHVVLFRIDDINIPETVATADLKLKPKTKKSVEFTVEKHTPPISPQEIPSSPENLGL